MLAAERGGVCRQFEQLAGAHRLTGSEGGTAQARAKPHRLLFVRGLFCHRGAFFFLLLWSSWSSIHVHDYCLRVGANVGVKPVSVFCVFSGRSVERNNSDVGPPGANKGVVLPKHSGVIWTMTWEILSGCDRATASSSHLPPNQIHPVLWVLYNTRCVFIIYHKDSGLWPSLENFFFLLLRLRKKAEDTARRHVLKISLCLWIHLGAVTPLFFFSCFLPAFLFPFAPHVTSASPPSVHKLN